MHADRQDSGQFSRGRVRGVERTKMGSNPGINLSLFFLAPASPDLRTVSHSHQPCYGAPTAANMSHPPLMSNRALLGLDLDDT